MGIRDKRFERAINKIIKEELQKGNLPSSREFEWRLYDYLERNNLSRPEFKFAPIHDGVTAMASQLNMNHSDIYSDLSTLYEGIIDIHGSLSKNFNKFEIEKSTVDYEVSVLENKLKEMILLNKDNGLLATVYDVFDDMEKVDTALTTAHVDIQRHTAQIPQIKNSSRKIVPEGTAGFSVLPELSTSVNSIFVSGTPSDAVKEEGDRTWQQLLVTKKRQAVGGFYFYHFDEIQKINQIDLQLHTIKPTEVRIEFSSDNINWFTLPYYEESTHVLDRYTFSFPSINMRKVRILLIKNEEDDDSISDSLDVKNGSEYKYLMGIKHLGFYDLSYPPEAELYSLPLRVSEEDIANFSISKVSLSVDERVPPATDIDYAIALVEEGKEPEWKLISPIERRSPKYQQIIDFRSITRSNPVRMSISKEKSLEEYELKSQMANGIRFYGIGEVENKKMIEGSQRLYVGRNAWGVKSFYKEQAAMHIPSIEDWEAPQDITHDFVHILDGTPGLLLDGKKHTKHTNYMFTSGVFSEKAQEVDSFTPISTEPITVYVNGNLVYEGEPNARTKVAYELNYGWNEVVILLYVSKPSAANGVALDLGIDIRLYGANIYAHVRALECVSLHDLRYNVKSNDRTKYAIDTIENNSTIILNHAVPGLTYDFYFDHTEGESSREILLRAIFKKNQQHSELSPQLNSYRLRFA